MEGHLYLDVGELTSNTQQKGVDMDTQTKVKKVLLVEDENSLFRPFELMLGDGIEVITATNTAEAINQFDKLNSDPSGDLVAIVVDGFGGTAIQTFRERGFKGWIVANSADEERNLLLLGSGADCRTPDKASTGEFLRELLNR